MRKVLFRRLIHLPVRFGQKVMFYNDSGTLTPGVICSVDIYFINGGRNVDIDFIVHPVTERGEENTGIFFTDIDLGAKLFTSRRRAARAERRRKREAHNH